MRTARTLASVSREMEEALLAACDDNDLLSANAWIELGANMNMICESGRTPICAAAQAGHLDIIQNMIDYATRQDTPTASSNEADDYSTDSDMSDEDEIWLSEEVSSSGDSDHSEHSRHPMGPRLSVSSRRSEGRSRANSRSLSCHCNETRSGEMCDNCIGNVSPLHSDVDLHSVYSRSNNRRNRRGRSPDFENIQDYDDLNDGRNDPRDDSGTDESDCRIELNQRNVEEYFNNIEGLRLRHVYNINEHGDPIEPTEAAVVAVALAAAFEAAEEANPPVDGAVGEDAEASNDEDDPEGGYVEVVEHVENNIQDMIEHYPRGYIFGIFDADDLDGLEVVSSSSDDSLVHYAFRFGRHGLMSSNPLYHASSWRSGIFSRTHCLTHRIPNPKSLNKKDHFGSRPIHYAIVGGHVEVLRELVIAGCKVNVGDEEKLFPLHMAVARDIPEEIDLLISSGARVNVRTVDKVTPLHVAASRGLLQNVKLLVENGAHVNVYDKFNRSPLYMAVLTHNRDIVAYLVTKGAKVNMEEVHGYTPLFEALTQKNVGMLRILAAAGANVNESPSLLHQAVLSRNEAMVREVLEAGCIINGREENGDTALMVAARTLQPKIIRILLEYGSAMELTNPRSGEGPIIQMMKYIRGNSRCFKEAFPIFLEHGLDLDCEVAYKCLQQSIAHGEDSVGALLIRRGAIAFSNIPEIYSQLAVDLFYEVVIRESWLLVKLFIYAGFNCKRLRMVSRSPSIIAQWIEKQKKNPLKLSELCRIVVRSKLDNKVFERVSFLNIPSSIQSYVKLENVT